MSLSALSNCNSCLFPSLTNTRIFIWPLFLVGSFIFSNTFVILMLCLRFVFLSVGANKKKLERERKKRRVMEKATEVPLIAHMHFKEGRSFAVPSSQREQNEILPLRICSRSIRRRGKLTSGRFFCVLRANNVSDNQNNIDAWTK